MRDDTQALESKIDVSVVPNKAVTVIVKIPRTPRTDIAPVSEFRATATCTEKEDAIMEDV